MKSSHLRNDSRTLKTGKLLAFISFLVGAIWLAACSGGGDPQFFVKKGCTECHSVSVYGFKSQNNSGPDLALAAEDVKKRFGRDLDSFLMSPTGTMQMVLSQKIKLTDDERREAIELIKEAYKKKMAEGGAPK